MDYFKLRKLLIVIAVGFFTILPFSKGANTDLIQNDPAKDGIVTGGDTGFINQVINGFIPNEFILNVWPVVDLSGEGNITVLDADYSSMNLMGFDNPITVANWPLLPSTVPPPPGINTVAGSPNEGRELPIEIIDPNSGTTVGALRTAASGSVITITLSVENTIGPSTGVHPLAISVDGIPITFEIKNSTCAGATLTGTNNGWTGTTWGTPFVENGVIIGDPGTPLFNYDNPPFNGIPVVADPIPEPPPEMGDVWFSTGTVSVDLDVGSVGGCSLIVEARCAIRAFDTTVPSNPVIIDPPLKIISLQIPIDVVSTWYVDDDAPPGGDGTSWETAFNIIQDAADVASSGDMIWVAEGTYISDTTAPVLTMPDGVLIYGGFEGIESDLSERGVPADHPTVLDGEDTSHHVVVGASNAQLDGFIVTGGNASGGGSESYGGGMYNDSVSNIVVANCTFSGNSAAGFVGYGGGMYNDSVSNLTVANCVFSGNSAAGFIGFGGGIYNSGSSPELTNCIFIGNSVFGLLGGGGGVCNDQSSPVLTNCTLNGNSVSGLFGSGGGMYNSDDSSPTITNCILWGDTDSTAPEISGPSTTTYSDIEGGYPGEGNIKADPLFVTGPNGDYYLSQTAAGQDFDSPCVDAGSDTAENLDLDKRTTRTDNVQDTGIVDMGYHYLDTIPPGGMAASPPGGAYCPISVTLSCDDPWAMIYYTLDGSEPDTGSSVYTEPIEISEDTTLKFIAIDYSGNLSATVTEVYDIDLEAPTGLAASPVGGSYLEVITVSLSASDGTIYYTTDGTEPTTDSPEYTGPIDISEDTTLKFMAVDTCGNQSATLTEVYDIDLEVPTVVATPAGGIYCELITVSLSASDGTIYYTLDGSGPTTASPVYAGPIDIIADTTLKFMAVDTSGNQSDTVTEVYDIDTEAAVAITSLVDGGTVGSGSVQVTGSADDDIASVTLSATQGTWSDDNPEVSGGVWTSTLQGLAAGAVVTIAVMGVDDCGNIGTGSATVFVPPYIWYVDTDATGSGTGLSWEDAFTVIQDAADIASNGDMIWVAEGTYTSDSTSPVLTMVDGVELYGGFAGTESDLSDRGDPANYPTILDGEDTSYHVVVGASNARLDGFTVTGGNAGGFGSDSYGGGMFNSSVTNLVVANCTFSENSASGLFSGGAGMYNEQSSPTITNCTFNGNSVFGLFAGGGGMYNVDNSSPAITNCTFSGNSASGFISYGGSMYNGQSSPVIINCLFSGNSASGLLSGGAGMYNNQSSPTITNCTFNGNSVSGLLGGGGGMYNSDDSLPTITNCIFWGDTDSTAPEIRGPSTTTYSDIAGDDVYSGEGNINADPLFVTGPNGDYYLSQTAAGQGFDSPCVDAGSDTAGNIGLDDRTTRIDGVQDTGIVDLGYHYPDTNPPGNLTASPPGGEYCAISVTLGCDDPNATIYFTTDSTEPTTDSSVYTGPIEINADTTLKFIAVDTNGNQSNTVTEVYDIDLEAPTGLAASPAGGSYCEATAVSLGASDGTIYYTTDGTEPTTDSPEYTGPVDVSADTTLKFMAVDTCWNQSDTVTEIYDIDHEPPTGLAASPAGGSYCAMAVSLSASDGTIYYTTDGTEPTTGSSVYTEPVDVSVDTTLKFMAVDICGNQSDTVTEVYDIDTEAAVAITSLLDGGTIGPGNVQVTGSADDDIASVTLSATQGTWSDNNPEVSGGVWSSNLQNLAAGTLVTIAVTGVDDCGNISTDSVTACVPPCIWHVDTDATGAGTGLSWEDAFTAIQDAAEAASSGDMIWVAEGTYTRLMGGNDVVLSMKEGVEVYGGFAGTEGDLSERGDPADHPTFLDGEDMSYHVVVGASNARLDGFVVTGGNACGWSDLDCRGGGMFNYSVTDIVVANCTFFGNSASQLGGGIYNDESSPEVTRCTFSGNSSIGSGGGMCSINESLPVIFDCTFSGNEAGYRGGGMYNFDSSPTITDCIFTDNSSAYYGGGMANTDDSSPAVTSCTFIGNNSDYGGGIFNSSSSPIINSCTFNSNNANYGGGISNWVNSLPEIINCIFKGNLAGYGGGIYNWIDSSPTITNCTFCGNSADYGGGLHNYLNSSPEITNCIFWGDAAPIGSEIYNIDTASNPIVTYSDIGGGYPGEGNIAVVPLFVGYPDLHLQRGSPCLDAGTATGAPSSDFDGEPRPLGLGYDMGAYEFRLVANWYVDIDAPPGGDGTSWETAFNIIQDAADAASSGHMIWVAEGTYTRPLGGTEPVLSMKDGVVVYGGFVGIESDFSERGDPADHPTVLNGENTSYHVVIGASNARLDGFVITGGNSDDSGGGMYNNYISDLVVATCIFSSNSALFGGGMYNFHSSAKISNCIFSDNSAIIGGGIYNVASSPMITNCTFSGNSASEYGGGICNEGSPSITNCVFSGNSAGSGGGIYNSQCSPEIINCTFTGNQALNYGGGIYNSQSSPEITNCTFSGNSATNGGGMSNWLNSLPEIINCIFNSNSATWFGGGIHNLSSSPTITNCIFSGNSGSYGGGMHNWSCPSPEITNCTFSGNSAEYNGGGICNRESSATIANCIMWGNTASTGPEIGLSRWGSDSPSTLTISYSDVQGGQASVYVCSGCTLNWGHGMIDADPLFVGYPDLHLQAGSPCIDAGTAAGAPSYDLDGNPRPLGFGYDMGAYELRLGADWYVDIDAPPGGDGTSWETAFNIIQDAADAAASGDTIWVAEGIYKRPQGGNEPVLTMKEGVIVYGGFVGNESDFSERGDPADHPTVLNGEYISNHAVVGASNARLDGFIVTGGNASGGFLLDSDGGGMYNDSVTNLLVANCTFSGNSAEYGGGGMYNMGSSSMITNCTFRGNQAERGGGISNLNSSLTITTCTFSENSAAFGGLSVNGDGGGMYNSESSLMITNCIFSGNLADDDGGGIYNWTSSPTMINCTFSENNAGSGGGMYNHWSSSPTITNCIFTGNTAVDGGGMYNYYESSPTIDNCTFSGNSAENDGGGMQNSIFSSPTITNCIFWGDAASTGLEIYNNSSNPTVTYSNIEGSYTGTGNIDADPLFVTGPNGDYYLSQTAAGQDFDSPCVDAGSDTAVNLGLDDRTTRTDYEKDIDIVDMGYHYPYYLDTTPPGGLAASPPEGAYCPIMVILSCEDPEAAIYFTLDGSEPTAESQEYTEPINIIEDTTLKFMAVDDFGNQSETFTEVYDIDTEAPTGLAAAPAGGSYCATTVIIMSDGTIYYTLDGSEPTAESQDYLEPIEISEDTTLKFMAMDDCGNQTETVTEVYDIDTEAPTGLAASPAGGSYCVTTVTLNASEGTIYFTLDGTEPDIFSAEYTGPIDLSADTTLKFMAVEDDCDNQAETVTEAYNIDTTANVTITSPLDGVTVIAGDILVSGTADTDITAVKVTSGQGHSESSAVDAEGNWSVVLSGLTVSGVIITAQGADECGSIGSDSVNVPIHIPVIWYVDADAVGAGTGLSWEDAFTVIQDAADAASGGDMIWVAEGTYTRSQGGNEPVLLMRGGVNVYGGFTGTESDFSERGDPADHPTVLDGEDTSYHVVVGASNALLDGFVVTGGNASGGGWSNYGGGMFNDGVVDLRVANCVFRDNRAEQGGGISNFYSSPKITDCTFSDNLADWGGGLSNHNYSSPEVTNCTFSGNSAEYGGGMNNYNYSSPEVTNCIFSGNSASGIYGGGGGIFNYRNSSPELTNCTFSGNSANSNGGGIYNRQYSSPMITNCILWGDTAPARPEIYNYDLSSEPTVTYSDIEGDYAGEGNIDADPLFVGYPDLHLQGESPCIDTGTATGAPSNDLGGRPRPSGSGYDMGAYEVQFWFVDVDAPPGGDGTSWETAFNIIQDAADVASAGDMIWVAEGTYTSDSPDSTVPVLTMKDGVKIYGGFNATESELSERGDPDDHPTILDGEDTSLHVVIGASNARLDGFTVTGGNANGSVYPDGAGGGMFSESISDLVVTNCTFSGNSAGERGGGMVNYYSSLEIINCNFIGNFSGWYGGGIVNYFSSPNITDCTFTENSAAGGGAGMYNNNSFSVITDCTFRNNSADLHGGGIASVFGAPTITNCTFRNNNAGDYGGGVIFWESSGEVINCIFTGNSTGGGGGGIEYHTCSINITNCTLSNNSAAYGGGICYFNSSTTITNCILRGNTAPTGPEIYNDTSSTSVVTYSDIEGGYAGTGNIDADPLFVTGPDGDYYLSQTAAGQPFDSPCVNAGSDTAENLGLDNRITRIDGVKDTGIVDMGYHYPDTISPGNLTASPPGGAYCPISVTLGCDDPEAAIYYTTDGTEPATGSLLYTGTLVYSGPIEITGDTTLKFMAIDNSGNQSSTVTEVYDIDDEAPTGLAASPAGNIYCEATTVSLSASEGTIYYTTDGNEPTTDSSVYTGPIEISADTTLKFMAVEDDCGNQAETVTEVYTIDTTADVTITSPVEGVNIIAGNLKVSGTADTDITTVTVTSDQGHSESSGVDAGGNWSVVLSGVTVPSVVITARGADNCGNIGSDSVTVPVYIPANIWFVDKDATGTGNGTSWEDAFTVIQDAADVASSGDMIWVAEGIYMRPTGLNNPVLTMKEGVTVYGGFAGTESDLSDRGDPADHPTILDGEDMSIHIVVGASNARLDGFIVTGGNARGGLLGGREGGGMYNDSAINLVVASCIFSGNSADEDGGGMSNIQSSLEITDCTFSDNLAGNNGGGIYNLQSSPTITNCAFSTNSADGDGGGMSNEVNSSPLITNCIFSGNSADDSGGISNTGSSSPEITDCTFSDNLASDDGGGMSNTGDSSPVITDCIFTGNSADEDGGGMSNTGNSSPVITDCTFSGNSAVDDGGGMFNDSVPILVVANCTFSGNFTSRRGGGIYNNDSSPEITNCTFSDNSASSDGGGMHNVESSPTIIDCIFSTNSADDGGGMSNYNYSSPTIINCIFSGNSAVGDGGGMFNTYDSSPVITNCTFGDNSASDEGGGMSNTDDSSPVITNCIFWGDTASGSGIEIYNSSSSDPVITYSDIEGSYTGTGNIEADPLFITGPNGDYYLSQTVAGQGFDSPCVDAGSDTAGNIGLDDRTTRIDGVQDTGIVDLGYHYPDTNPPGNLTASPPGGEYCAISVTLGCDDPEAAIYYTTDGSLVNTGSLVYTEPIFIGADTTLKFMAVDAFGNRSETVTEVYAIDTVPPEIVIISPTDGAVLGLADDNDTFTPDVLETVVHISVDAEDGQIVTVTVDGVYYEVSVTAGTAELPVDLDNCQDFVITASADIEDECGNQAIPAVANIAVDLTTPAVNIISPIPGECVNPQSVLVVGGYDDTCSGVSAVIIDGVTAALSGSSFSGSFTADLIYLPGVPPEITATVVDRAGNSSSFSINVLSSPSPPAHLQIVKTEDSATLTWDPNPEDDIDYYLLDREPPFEPIMGSDGPNHRTIKIPSSGELSYTDYDGVGNPYTYILKAVNYNGCESEESRISAVFGIFYGMIFPDEDNYIEFLDIRMFIPEGAVFGNTEIIIDPLAETFIPPNLHQLGNIYDVRIADLDTFCFLKPIQVTLPYDLSRLPAGFTEDDVRIFVKEDEETGWQMMKLINVDKENKTVTAEIKCLSQMLAGALSLPSSPTPAGSQATGPGDLPAADPTAGLTIISPPGANFSGSASLRFPIEVPPGRNGMQPKLALVYDSSKKNGLCGVGWDFPVPSIQRSTKNGVPNYAMWDTFIADGAELVDIINYDLEKREYRAKIEGAFMRYIYYFSQEKWIVYDKNGTKYEYGYGDCEYDIPGYHGYCSREIGISTSGKYGIFRWYLTKIEDTNGNYIKYYYTRDVPEVYLSRIEYTGNVNTEPKMSVELIYGNRSDYTSSYITGREKMLRKRLEKIITKVNSEIVREYNLYYSLSEMTSRSLLTSINITKGDQSLPATTFDYLDYNDEKTQWVRRGFIPTPFTRWPWPDYPKHTDEGVKMADVNGDGLVDFVQALAEAREEDFYPAPPFARQNVWLNTGSGWSKDDDWSEDIPAAFMTHRFELVIFEWLPAWQRDVGTRLIDVNRDGRPDFIRSFISFADIEHNNVWLNNGIDWIKDVTPKWNIPDIFTSWRENRPFSDRGLRMGDVNGDGLVDFVRAFQEEDDIPIEKVWLNTGDDWEYDEDWSNHIPARFVKRESHTWDYGTRLVDVNGDGLADFIRGYVNLDGEKRKGVWLNNGRDWVNKSDIWNVPAVFSRFPDYMEHTDEGLRIADVNGDGLVDFVQALAETSSADETVPDPPFARQKVWLNTGSGWEYDEDWSSRIREAFIKHTFLYWGEERLSPRKQWNVGTQLTDVNGDGLADLIMGLVDVDGEEYRKVLLNGRLYQTGPSPVRETEMHIDLLTKIDNGIGGTTELEYELSSEYDNTGSDDIPDMPVVLHNLSRVTVSDGLDNSYSTEFSYADGIYVKAEKDLRGFGIVITKDPLGNTTTAYYHQGKYDKGKTKSHELRDSAGNLYKRTEMDWQVEPTEYPGVKFVKLAQKRDYVYNVDENNGDETYRASGVEYEYDEYGNVTLVKNYGEINSDGNDLKTDDNIYENTEYSFNTKKWILNKPKTKYTKDHISNILSQTWYSYDWKERGIGDKGNLTKTEYWLDTPTEPNPYSLQWYDSYGNVIRERDVLWQETGIAYDTEFFTYPIIARTYAAGHRFITTETYDYSTGNMLTSTDVDGYTTKYQYDDFGRQIKFVGPTDSEALPTIENIYSLDQFPIRAITKVRQKSSRPEILDTYIFCDGMGRAVQTRKPYMNGQQIVSGMVEYNERGEVIETGQPFIKDFSKSYYDYQPNDMINPTVSEYDPIGRLIKTDFPDGASSQTTYGVDFIISTDANGKNKKIYSDIYKRTVKIVEYNGEETYETQYEYDLLGNLTHTIDNEGNIIQTFYDSLGRKIGMIDPDMGHWTYQYDAAGNLKYQEDNIGHVTTFRYDQLGRLILKDYHSSSPKDVNVRYFYDDYDGVSVPECNTKGKLTRVIDGSGETRFYYDSLGRVIENIQIIDGIDGVEYRTKTSYDLMNRTEFIEYPDGEVVSFSYNEAGQLNSVVGDIIYIDHIEYDQFGQRIRQENGNGTVTEYEYNYQTSLLDKILTKKGEVIIQDLDYIFDNVGNITELTDNVQGSKTEYEYDDLYRLTKVSNPDYTRNYSYDSIGNITFKKDVGDYDYNGTGPHAVTRAGLYEFEYDANGNMTRKSYNNNEKFQELSYDYDNRVTTISNELNNRVDFVYDYTGKRVRKVYSGGLDTTYVNNLYEFKSDGTVTKHIFDGVRRVVSRTSGVGPSWYHTDHLGSTNLLTDESGDVIQHTEYYPYGETRVSEGEEISQYKFTGQEFDPETGIYYYGARYYDPVIARFISADSIVPDPSNPQDFNRYTYVRNNPIIYSDPTGHFLFSAILVGAWLGGVTYAATADNATFSGLLESFAIGAAAGALGAVTGAGTHLLGKAALAGFELGGVGADIIAGALAGAAALGAAYSFEVAATGGQWTWKGFGMSAGIGLVTGGIAGYYKSAHLKKYRGKYETFWGKRLINPTGGQIRGLDDWGAGHWWADRRADGVWYPHRAIDIEGVVGQEVRSPITGFYTKVAVGTRNEGVLIVGTFRGEPVALKILHFNVNLSGTSGLITAGDPMGTLMDLGQYYARITPHVHIKMFVNYNVVNPTEYFFP